MFISTKGWVLPIFVHPIFDVLFYFLLWEQTTIKELTWETKWAEKLKQLIQSYSSYNVAWKHEDIFTCITKRAPLNK